MPSLSSFYLHTLWDGDHQICLQVSSCQGYDSSWIHVGKSVGTEDFKSDFLLSHNTRAASFSGRILSSASHPLDRYTWQMELLFNKSANLLVQIRSFKEFLTSPLG